MKYIKYLLSIVFLLTSSLSNADDTKTDKIHQLLYGMYELETWVDEELIYKYPDVAGTLVVSKGKIAFTLDNSINNKKTVKVIGWGTNILEADKFSYKYNEFKVLIIQDDNKTVNSKLPWEGNRIYDLELKGEELLLSANNGSQTWLLNKDNLIYTDTEWGLDKKYAQRVWRRIK